MSDFPYGGHPGSDQWADEDGIVHDVNAEASPADRYPAVDWHAAFANQPTDVPWLAEPMLERGRSYALFSPAKQGKSLLAQDISARLATGQPTLGSPAAPPVHVLYIDAENAIADIVERLTAYGYGPDDLSHLHYLSFPALPPLDHKLGGQHLADAAEHYKAELVVIDTTTRFVAGKENDSDTFHELYRNALVPLKAAGITVVRLDHAGKDPERGQRGSSAKGTDVDVVWRLTLDGPRNVTLTREASRNTHHPERVHLTREFEPLRHVLADGPALAIGTLDAVNALDRLEIPLTAGRDICRAALATDGLKLRNETLAAAVKYRKERAKLEDPT